LRDDWRQARTRIENQSRHQHAWAAIEALTFTAYSTLSLSMTLQSKLVQLAWLVAFDGKCHVSNWLVDREKMRSDRQFERLLLESKMHDPPRCDAPMPSTQAGSAFFAHLPAEIRRRILTLAFGEQTVHMHLDYRRPHRTLSS
jgi:hypothetical protein